MARRYRRRYYRKKRRSNPSFITTSTSMLRKPFHMMGIKSPVLATMLSMPLALGLLSRFSPDMYDRWLEMQENINERIQDIGA